MYRTCTCSYMKTNIICVSFEKKICTSPEAGVRNILWTLRVVNHY